MILVRSAVFNILLVAFTLLVGVLGLPSFLLGRRAVVAVSRFWSRTLVAMARVVAGIDVDLRGAENLPKGAAIVAAKPQSAWETLYFTELLDRLAAVQLGRASCRERRCPFVWISGVAGPYKKKQ